MSGRPSTSDSPRTCSTSCGNGHGLSRNATRNSPRASTSRPPPPTRLSARHRRQPPGDRATAPASPGTGDRGRVSGCYSHEPNGVECRSLEPVAVRAEVKVWLEGLQTRHD
jgi:hypothetical protein